MTKNKAGATAGKGTGTRAALLATTTAAAQPIAAPVVTIGHNGPPEPDRLPAYMPVEEWCDFAGIGRTLNYELCAFGHIRSIKVKGRRLIDVASGLAYLRSQEVPPDPARMEAIQAKARAKAAAVAAKRKAAQPATKAKGEGRARA